MKQNEFFFQNNNISNDICITLRIFNCMMACLMSVGIYRHYDYTIQDLITRKMIVKESTTTLILSFSLGFVVGNSQHPHQLIEMVLFDGVGHRLRRDSALSRPKHRSDSTGAIIRPVSGLLHLRLYDFPLLHLCESLRSLDLLDRRKSHSSL